MVRVSPRGPQLLAMLVWNTQAVELGDFWIDRFEVTNRAYKAFVDAGGYSERRFWNNPFIKAGKTMAWEEAMAGFHDSTGRPGPSTWELGTYPEGKDEFPVGGVSWYEAAAYSEFAGKSLPTIFHWSVVADRRATSSVLLPRGRYLSDGRLWPSAGQARSAATGRTILPATRKSGVRTRRAETGVTRWAAAGTIRPTSSTMPTARSPWDRSPALGFRSMKVVDPRTVRIGAPRAGAVLFSRFQPRASGLRRRVSGLCSALQRTTTRSSAAVVRSSDDSARDWRHEIVEFNAAYGGERMTAHVFLPKRAAPPFQTLMYFPGINALHQRSSR